MKRFILLLSFLFAALFIAGCEPDDGTDDVDGGSDNIVKKCSISFYDDSGERWSDIGGSVKCGETVELAQKYKTDYTFNGWLLNGRGEPLSTDSYVVLTDTIFIADWKADDPNIIEYRVFFYDSDNVVIPELIKKMLKDTTITLPNMTKDGYSFDGWVVNGEIYAAGSFKVTGHIYFTLKWSRLQCAVNYHTEAGVLISGIGGAVDCGNSITLESRNKTGYTFDGWLENDPVSGALKSGRYTVNADVNFYEKWSVESVACTVNTNNYPGFTPIRNVSDLNRIRNDLSGKYILTGNISLSRDYAGGWTPIGSEAAPFIGVLNGNGCRIDGLYVADADSAGLFGYIGAGAEVKDLTIETAAGGVRGIIYAGVLAGRVKGTNGKRVSISNIRISGSVRAENTVPEGFSAAGGVAGNIIYTDVTGCSNNAVVSSNANYTTSGGIIGLALSFVVEDGVVADINEVGDSTISASHNTGTISSYSSVCEADSGGIAGAIGYNSDISASSNSGTISAASDAAPDSECGVFSGGIAGWIDENSSIRDSYNTGSVSVSGGEYSYAGGIAGEASFDSSVSGSHNEGGVSASAAGYADAGGIVGDLYESELSNSYNIGEVSANSTKYSATSGGIAGYFGFDSTISASYNTGKISAESSGMPSPCTEYCNSYPADAGGIAGTTDHSIMISNSYNIGDISAHSLYADARAGGIAGQGEKIVSACYNKGKISATADSGDAYSGGIAGYYYGESYGEPPSTLKNSAAINSTISAEGATVYIGRVAGYISAYSPGDVVTNNFANSSMSHNGSTFSNSTENGVGKSPTALKTKSTYQNAVTQGGLGWKFGNNAANPWVLGAFTDYAYPTLWWQTEKP